MRGVVVRIEERRQDRPLESIAAVVIDAPLFSPPQDRLWEWLALRYCAPRGLTYARAVPRRVRVSPLPADDRAHALVSERLLAYPRGADLLESIRSGDAGTWCLRTAPGEDRAALVSELVAASSGSGAALVAVPEVRYGSAALDELMRRWPHTARIDTSLPEGQRARGWLSLATGHPVGAGGRAAVLAPSPGLRLIVVDDEHNAALKEDQAPRFDARRVARERARIQEAICVLVSPTPTVEIGAARAWGRIRGVDPTRAMERRGRPTVELLEPSRGRVLSADLHRNVGHSLAAGGRVALLAPRRGYSPTIWCRRCRRSLRCPRCESGLAYDRTTRGGSSRVRCPRCTLTAPPPDSCPSCGAVEWAYLGAGSERLAEQVRKAWPRAKVARADPDEERQKQGEKPPDIYVTTWFGTKPVLRPDVSMVAVLDADALIHRPDFRAAEHAYQALAEMAQWAGPASNGGRLVVQTSEPGHHAIQAVARADYGFFLSRELELREELGYPPFSELIELRSSGEGSTPLMDAAVKASQDEGARVLGPAPVAERPGDLRALIKCQDAAVVATRLRDILAGAPRGTRLRVDVDPR